MKLRAYRFVIEIPILSYLGFFGGYLATSGAKYDVIFLLGDPDFLLGDKISHLYYLVIQIPILGYLGFWGYFATSGAKSDVIILLGDPDFLQR